MKCICRTSLFAVVFGLSVVVPIAARAQESYPDRPIRIIYPFPPGGAADTLTRIVADRLATKLGQPVLVESRAGASGNIGADMVAHAKPDGYTLLASPPPPLVVNKSLFPQLPFDPAKFEAITVLAAAPNVLVAHPKLPANNVADLVALAKKRPGGLNYASTGSGGTPHLTAEWFKLAAGVNITHIPYKGVQAYQAILAGDIDVMFMNLGDAMPYLRGGRLKALAVASEERLKELPEVETLANIIPGFVSTTWFAVVATPGTPPAITEKLSAAIAEALRLPEVQTRLLDLHLQPVGGSPAQTASFLRVEAQRWNRIIRTANLHAD